MGGEVVIQKRAGVGMSDSILCLRIEYLDILLNFYFEYCYWYFLLLSVHHIYECLTEILRDMWYENQYFVQTILDCNISTLWTLTFFPLSFHHLYKYSFYLLSFTGRECVSINEEMRRGCQLKTTTSSHSNWFLYMDVLWFLIFYRPIQVNVMKKIK